MNSITIPVIKSSGYTDLDLPSYQTAGASDMDLLAAVEHEITIKPGERKMISTGISIQIPDGYEAQIRPRSGLAIKWGITVLNSPGTIDSDYRGEIKVLLANLGDTNFEIKKGMRIAQMVLTRVERAVWNEEKILSKTKRNLGGFGSTGVSKILNKNGK